MKQTFTTGFFLLCLAMLTFTSPLDAQILHEIEVTSNDFTPSTISISQGDTVRWTNVQGNHNVNGTTEDYPNNPEGFGNDVGSGWTYEFIFEVPGFYEYKCDPHESLGMVGDITVEETTSILDLELSKRLVQNVYPQPAQDYVYLELNTESLSSDTPLSVQVFDIKGTLVMSMESMLVDRIQINTSALSNGTYMFNIISDKALIGAGKLLKL